MTATEEFFEEFGRVRGDSRLRSCTGTLCFDIQRGHRTEHWFITIERGDVRTERRTDDADCEVKGEGDLLDEVVLGRQNATAALLRGAFQVTGDVGLLMSFQRFFPGPPDQRGPSRQRAAREPASTGGGR